MIAENEPADHEQLQSVCLGLEQISKKFKCYFSTYEHLPQSLLQSKVRYHILMVSGNSGVAYLSTKAAIGHPPSLKIIWMGDRVLSGLLEVAHLTDLIFLPQDQLTEAKVIEFETRTRLTRLPSAPRLLNAYSMEQLPSDSAQIAARAMMTLFHFRPSSVASKR